MFTEALLTKHKSGSNLRVQLQDGKLIYLFRRHVACTLGCAMWQFADTTEFHTALNQPEHTTNGGSENASHRTTHTAIKSTLKTHKTTLCGVFVCGHNLQL